VHCFFLAYLLGLTVFSYNLTQVFFGLPLDTFHVIIHAVFSPSHSCPFLKHVCVILTYVTAKLAQLYHWKTRKWKQQQYIKFSTQHRQTNQPIKKQCPHLLTIQSEELLAKTWTMWVVRPLYLRALPAQLIGLLPCSLREPSATHDVVSCWLGSGRCPGRMKTFPMASTDQTLCSVTATWTSFTLPAYTIHHITEELFLLTIRSHRNKILKPV